jgi:hypothetical protein
MSTHKAIEFGYHTRVPDLAAAYALQGKMEEARSALNEALHADPTLTVRSIEDRFPLPQAVIEGLRKAGLPRSPGNSPGSLTARSTRGPIMAVGATMQFATTATARTGWAHRLAPRS